MDRKERMPANGAPQADRLKWFEIIPAYVVAWLVLGLVFGVARVANDLIWWDLGRDICDYVVGTGGMLQINPNEGGTIVYSCNLRPGDTVRAVVAVAIAFSPLTLILAMPFAVGYARYRHDRKAARCKEFGAG